MKKIIVDTHFFIAVLLLAVVIASCKSAEIKSSGVETVEKSENMNFKPVAKAGFSNLKSSWNLSKLDTARKVNYLSNLEKDIILQMNMVRTNPKLYAEQFIKPRLSKFEGTLYNGIWRTEEGASAVKECINVLNGQKSLPVLKPSKGLSKAAKAHVEELCRYDRTGHKSKNGDSPYDRMERFGNWKKSAAENISYNNESAQDTIISLLIDDGVKSRGHRNNILDEEFEVAGVGYSSGHKTYDNACVIDYAAEYIEN